MSSTSRERTDTQPVGDPDARDELPAQVPGFREFLSLAASRRSVRAFDGDRPVTDEQVRGLIEAARWAPSGGNSQPWHFVVVRDPDDRAWNNELFVEQNREKLAMEKAARGRSGRTGGKFHKAPVHIIVLGDPRVKVAYPVRTMLDKAERHLHAGLSNATLLLMLAATSMGLGTRYISDAGSPYMSTMLKVHYGIPDFFRVYELVPVGWPAKTADPPPRRTVDEMLHVGRFSTDQLLSDEELKHFLLTQTRLGSYGRGKPRTSEIAERSMYW